MARTFTITLNDADEALLVWHTEQANAAIAEANARLPELGVGKPAPLLTSEQLFDLVVQKQLSGKRGEYDAWLAGERAKVVAGDPELQALIDAKRTTASKQGEL